MAHIVPFRGIRPAAHIGHLLPSSSIDRYSRPALLAHLAENPYSFLHIIQPDFKDGQVTEAGSLERLQKVKRTYQQYCADDLLVQDQRPSFYLYRQITPTQQYTGIIACISIDDYFDGVIKVHEQTLTDREEKLKDYLAVCGFNAEPVLFCYEPAAAIEALTAKLVASPATIEFSSADGLQHQLWVIDDAQQVAQLQESFSMLDAVYIADGHHRSATSALLGKSRRIENPSYKGDEPFNFYLGIFFPENALRIVDYNRLVKDLNGLSTADFLERLSANFEIENKGQTLYQPTQLHEFSMYLGGDWYALRPKGDWVDEKDPVASLDASILTAQILSPLLGISDLKTDKRVQFLPGIHGMAALKDQVDSGKATVAFGMYPVSMVQLKRIADTGNTMPPKSTWIEPKMRNGLVIYNIA